MKRGHLDSSNLVYTSQKKADELSSHSFRSGDILVSKLGDDLGRACIVPDSIESGIVSADVVRIRIDPSKALTKYVMHAINSPSSTVALAGDVQGVTRPRVGLNDIRRLKIPICDLEEQSELVKRIEDQLRQINSLTNIQHSLNDDTEALQSSILKAACDGKLVPTEAELAKQEGRDYEPAHQLLERILAERRAKFETEHPRKKYKEPIKPDTTGLDDLPVGWSWCSFDECIIGLQNGLYKKKEFYNEDGIACLRMYNIHEGEIVWRNIKRLILTQDEIAKFQLMAGDLLINRVNSAELVGKSAVVPNFDEEVVYESKNIRVRLDTSLVNPNYIHFCLQHLGPGYYRKNVQQTTGMASINQDQLRKMPIPLPPLIEQNRIVLKMNNINESVHAIENCRTNADDLSRAMKISILENTFNSRGESR